MSDSIRDQLLALGFAKSKPQQEQRRPEHQRPPKDARHGSQGPRPDGRGPDRAGRRPHGAASGADGAGAAQAKGKRSEFDLAKAYAIRAQTERQEREQAQRDQEERARQNKERKLKLQQLLADKSLNAPDADVARHFPHGTKIRRVYVTAEQLAALNRGELGVVQIAGRYLVVRREVALAAQAISADALVLLPDPNAPTDDDVPADLVW